MPQPALHLLLALQELQGWSEKGTGPVEAGDPGVRNAFLHGCLAPDMGNFPGGDRQLARAVHTRRTADVTHSLLAAAENELQRAFAWGWLNHVLADAAIHPLVNARAADFSPGGVPDLLEHVRVEVGLDVWFCWQQPVLEGLRLEAAFTAPGYTFLARALKQIDQPVTSRQLARMEKGLMLFSHAAVHFAHRTARQLCWGDDGPRVPFASAVLWHTASRFSPRRSTARAYLSPRAPDETLIANVSDAIERVRQQFALHVADGVADLPNYNLEDGTVLKEGRRVA